MGLDQYIYKKIPNEYEEDGRAKVEELHYWRKNYQLNEWACDHWCPDDIVDFNCKRLELESRMIENLISYILYNMDKSSKDSEGYDGILGKDMLSILLDCKEKIKNGDTLYYWAWW